MKYYLLVFLLAIVVTLNWLCTPANVNSEIVYQNHHDTVSYVGMAKCLTCHADKKSFLETGMGKSFHQALTKHSKALFNNRLVFDTLNNLYYKAITRDTNIFIYEYRLEMNDTVYSNIVKLNHIVGSGQHTNSHMVNTNGFVTQAPITFYTQKGIWDLPPGFEKGMNTRFERKIGLECMTCHNAYPKFVPGSENKYTNVPNGIDCERCHGPGEAHVNQFYNGIRIDTAKLIDYSIVNPAKLPVDLQFDICQRCHLQGNTILQEGKSFFDFKPGQKLSNTLITFLPKYENRDDEFIMASHADRLKMSKCFIESEKNAKNSNDKLRPYKDALTCVTCHNPHLSVKSTLGNVFNQKCIVCHKTVKHESKIESNNCVSCHMPNSGSIDIPHVSVHDHYIRKPIKKSDESKLRKFVGLRPINFSTPSYLIMAKAYLNQYEKFDNNPFLIDSALYYLSKLDVKNDLNSCSESIRAFFLKGDYQKVTQCCKEFKGDILNQLNFKSLDNAHAWTAYRIGETYVNMDKIGETL